ncbi:hypothetical protein EGY05_21980 [Chryseobacterium arthrosphaerae]|uniref:2TM domain-containing protein n=1 Tax=Chryseobacterium arthrosphaerae TaxID=651561 RepID=UPI000F50BEBA|nr:2TM domain-containing protein [Chryseobacterium arthrosphaerae]AYZ14427.1 hypothetical protein EGY05_21980 [Chryseobacterium arthrosphaerae]
MDYNSAYNRVQKLKKFYKNLIWFGIITAIVLGNDWLNNEIHYKIFGGHLLLSIWAIILTVKAFSLFVFDNEWERKIIENETQNNKKTADF